MEEKSSQKQKYNKLQIPLEQASVSLYKSIFSIKESQSIFRCLKQDLNWQQHHIRLFGKEIPEPRLIDWYSEKEYRYSNKTMPVNAISQQAVLADLKSRVENITGFKFNSVLCNYYRNGQDSMSWHQDNEKELGKDPQIASLSFGMTRKFRFRSIDKKEKTEVLLEDSDLLLMSTNCQKFYKHALPKTNKKGERINLTFRLIY